MPCPAGQADADADPGESRYGVIRAKRETVVLDVRQQLDGRAGTRANAIRRYVSLRALREAVTSWFRRGHAVRVALQAETEERSGNPTLSFSGSA